MSILTEDELYCDVEKQIKELDLKDTGSQGEYDSEHEASYYADDFYLFGTGAVSTQLIKSKTSQPIASVLRKYSNKVCVGALEHCAVPMHAKTALQETEKRLTNDRMRVKDKQDRATAEQVMDPRTRMILYKLLHRGVMSEIYGCISTGKEANVYYAISTAGPLAVKVFKTSILVFKDRDQYVSGEYRFRHGYSRHNPRKMVSTWAEKEFRNLNRMHSNGLMVPKPVLLKQHVLIMEFIGYNDWAACKLKDAELNIDTARHIYRDLIVSMWVMYHQCKLIHADLSEYNLLFMNNTIYIIDVSQSVEHDHPNALVFLRKDCTNVTEFFRKKGVATMTVKELFDFVTDTNITKSNMDKCLDVLSERAQNRTDVEDDDEAFKNVFIPKTLYDVVDCERDIFHREHQSNQPDTYNYRVLMGLKEDLTVATKPEMLESEDDSLSMSSGDSCSTTEDMDDEEESKSKFVSSSRCKHETLEEKKQRKQAVKDAKAAKRVNKVKKHIKKRKCKPHGK